MKTGDHSVVKGLMERLGDWNTAAENVQVGHIDATIYGRYFAESLSDEDFEELRSIALRHVAKETFTIIGKLGMHGIPVEDSNGNQMTLISHIIEHYTTLYPEPYRKKIK